MTITRSNVATYLNTQFSALAATIGQTASDASASGFGSDIDNALRKLGKTESELATATVEDGSRDAVFALGEYYAARRIWRLLGDRVNHTMGATTYNFDGQRKQAQAMMDDAQRLCAVLGYDVNGAGMTIGDLNLDWLEPNSAIGFSSL